MAAPQRSSRSSIKYTRLHPTIGAEVEGVDLRHPLDVETTQQLLNLLVTYKVLFFRDQVITQAQQIQFGRHFGQLEAFDSDLNAESAPEVVKICSGPESRDLYTDTWHSDASFLERPTMAVILRAIELPDVGGDTLFADMAAAYRGLPARIKNRLAGLSAVHDGKKIPVREYDEASHAHHTKDFPSFEHPVVRTHPYTREKILYVNALYTTRICGLSAEESDELLALLLAQASVPEYQVRFRWQPNSVAFWDNRSTQHYASADYGQARRYMERIAVAGDRPY